MSALIFVIAVEILACRIRQDKNLKGIQIKLDGRTHSLKLCQLADDTTVFVQSKIEISIAFNIIETFGSFSGLIPCCSTRVSLVLQELLTLPEFQSSPRGSCCSTLPELQSSLRGSCYSTRVSLVSQELLTLPELSS